LTDYRLFRDSLAGAAKVAILGAGLIGCEFANDLIGAGYRVAVADPAAWPLSQLIPSDCGKAVAGALAHAGVRWHLGHAAVAVSRGARALDVVLDNGEVLHADVVLSAVGLRADTRLAEAAGLAVDRGIRVDRSLRTSDEHIYALGDCAEVDGHWRPYVAPLMQCARTLGKNLGTGEARQVAYPSLPIIVKTHVCPVLAYPPISRHGQWAIGGKNPDIEARFVDDANRTLGFALTGQATKKRREHLRDAPPLM
jgi:rubredoxin-NAD+ reductase